MRIGIIGPASDDSDAFKKAVELLIADPEVRQVIYVGQDDAADKLAASWIPQHLDEEEFFVRAAALALSGSATEITSLLDRDREQNRLSLLRKLPEPPARAIEMLEKWIVLGVHDKAALDEDDIANAHIIVYGRAPEADFKRFGPRCFFTPGPVDKGKVGVLTLLPHGDLEVRILDLDGKTLLREEVHSKSGKLVVTS
jgi:hypothetical protein